MDYPEMAGDVAAPDRARRACDRASVMGHSMGGKTAMALALLHPQRVGRLVVVDIAPVTLCRPAVALRRSHAGRSTRCTPRAATKCGSAWRSRCRDPGVVAFLMQNLVARNAHFDWRINLAGNRAVDAAS